MAIGSGKTYTAVTETHRLLKHAKANRILFLVDRNNLGRQAKKEFERRVKGLESHLVSTLAVCKSRYREDRRKNGVELIGYLAEMLKRFSGPFRP